VVAQGNDFDSSYTGYVTCLRGKLTVKTDQVTGSPAVAAAVTVNASGLLEAAGANVRYGFVLANNIATDGTVTVELDI
jgi:hypothetical protein